MEDSTNAILEAIGDAFKVDNNGLELLPGIKDLGGVVIDLQGGNYRISNPIRFPSGAGNVLVRFHSTTIVLAGKFYLRSSHI